MDDADSSAARARAKQSPGLERPLALHVVTSLDFGGIESHMALLGDVAMQGRYRHVFCALGRGGRIERQLRKAGLEVTCLERRVRIPSMSALCALLGLIRQRRPRVVHTHGAEANFHGLPAAALARVPVRIGEEIGMPSHSWLASRLFQGAYLQADAVIGVSGQVTRWLVAREEVPAAKATTLFVPVRLPSAREQGWPDDAPFRACFVGRLEPVKNLAALIDAFAGLHQVDPRAELWVIGEGSLRSSLQAQALKLSLGAAVRFFGFQLDPAPLVRQCDICVQPSLSEGFGLALVESMGCAVPVVSTRVGAAPELIQDGETGWLLEGCGADDIRAGLLRAHALTGVKRAELGRAARRAVVDRFEPGEYLSRLERIYDDCDPRVPS